MSQVLTKIEIITRPIKFEQFKRGVGEDWCQWYHGIRCERNWATEELCRNISRPKSGNILT